jgi:hypothetical protein
LRRNELSCFPSEEIWERSCASAEARLRSATPWRYWTKAVAYRFATRAASDGSRLMAVTEITFVWPTSEADTAGALPSWARTACCTGALVTSCSSVSTSVWVTGCACAAPSPLAPRDGCTSNCAVAEYSLWAVSANARLPARPSATVRTTHHLRRRRICRYARNEGSVPNSVIVTFSLRKMSIRRTPAR